MIAPIEKSIHVKLAPQKAFELFTAKMSTWWPFDGGHSVFGGKHAQFLFEEKVGGHVKEVGVDGSECVWGTVTTWGPPSRFVMTWHPGRGPETAQELEVTFTSEADGTRVKLIHRGWEILGAGAQKTYEGYTRGWDFVFAERFGSAAAS